MATNTPANATSNYNTTIDFNGNAAGNLKVLENFANLNLLDNTFASSTGSFFGAYFLPSTSVQGGCHVINYREASGGTVDGIQFRAKLGANTGRLAIGSGGNSVNASHDWVQSFIPDIISYYGNRSGANTYLTFERSLGFTGGVASSTTGDQGLFLGARYSGGGYNGLYDGFISELIFYNRDLTPAEMARVHTYLAVKYGVTLQNTGGGTQGDYVSTNSTVVWDASLNPAYHNDVIGIARDDAEGLLQKQSHAFTDHTRIYLSALQSTNTANTGSFSANNSYVIAGHNNDALCASAGAGAEVPGTPFLFSRLEREWKITKTNFSQSFNLDIVPDTCAIPGGLDPNFLRLLVDDDGNFSNATVFAAGGGLSFGWTGGEITVSGISNTHIPDNSTRYITIGYATPSITLSGDNTICQGDSSPVVFNITGAAGPINLSYTDGSNVFNVSGVSDGDTLWVSPTTATTYTVNQSLPLNCCGNQQSSSVTISINPNPNVTATAAPASLCAGDSTILSGGGAVSYVWDNGATDGVPVYPANTTTYTVTGTDPNGCTDTAQVLVTVNPLPNVAANATAIVLCDGDQVTLTGSGAQTYVWDNGVTDGVAFTPTTTTNYLVTGTDANGCEDTASILITVNPLPTVVANASVTEICEGDSVQLTGSGAQTYSWDNGAVDGQYFSPVLTTTFTVTGTDANNCEDTDQVTVTVNPSPTISVLNNADTLCFGASVTLAGQGADVYTWSNGVTDSVAFQPDTSATYSVVGTDTTTGCSDSSSIRIVVIPDSSFSLGADTSFCPGNIIEICGPDGYVSYSWQHGPNLRCIEVLDGDTYSLTVVNAAGCIFNDEIILSEIPDCDSVLIPNVFSPNNDGINDVFRVEGDFIGDFTFSVYDRWGALVYSSKNPLDGWDGRNGNGTACPEGVYYYALRYNLTILPGNHEEAAGTVTLLR